MTRELNYQFGEEMVKEEVEAMEKEWDIIVPAVRETYAKLKETNPELAKVYLTDFVHAQAAKMWDWADQMTLAIVDKKDKESKVAWRKTL